MSPLSIVTIISNLPKTFMAGLTQMTFSWFTKIPGVEMPPNEHLTMSLGSKQGPKTLIAAPPN